MLVNVSNCGTTFTYKSNYSSQFKKTLNTILKNKNIHFVSGALLRSLQLNFLAHTEVGVSRCSVKKVFLEISQNSQKNTSF